MQITNNTKKSSSSKTHRLLFQNFKVKSTKQSLSSNDGDVCKKVPPKLYSTVTHFVGCVGQVASQNALWWLGSTQECLDKVTGSKQTHNVFVLLSPPQKTKKQLVTYLWATTHSLGTAGLYN